MPLEIERKFHVSSIPADLLILSATEIHQSYLATGNEEVRIRWLTDEHGEAFTLTFKRGKGMTREELETPISEATYKQLLQGSHKKPLIKTRNRVKIDGHYFDMDIYTDPRLIDKGKKSFITIEIEFKSEKEAEAFKPEPWFSEELTNYTNFKNQNLWKQVQ